MDKINKIDFCSSNDYNIADKISKELKDGNWFFINPPKENALIFYRAIKDNRFKDEPEPKVNPLGKELTSEDILIGRGYKKGNLIIFKGFFSGEQNYANDELYIVLQ